MEEYLTKIQQTLDIFSTTVKLSRHFITGNPHQMLRRRESQSSLLNSVGLTLFISTPKTSMSKLTFPLKKQEIFDPAQLLMIRMENSSNIMAPIKLGNLSVEIAVNNIDGFIHDLIGVTVTYGFWVVFTVKDDKGKTESFPLVDKNYKIKIYDSYHEALHNAAQALMRPEQERLT